MNAAVASLQKVALDLREILVARFGRDVVFSDRLKAMIAAVAPTVVCCTPTYALRLAEVDSEQTADRRPLSESLMRRTGKPISVDIANELSRAAVLVSKISTCFE